MPHHHHHRAPRLTLSGSARWIIPILVAVVILTTAGIGFILALPPTPSLTASHGVVSLGETLNLHGQGFVSGGDVKLTLDGHLPLFTSPKGTVAVSDQGTFDLTIPVSEDWPAGRNVIQATEALGARSASTTFTFHATPPRLEVQPSSLKLGKLNIGSKVSFSILATNRGGLRLKWTADTGGANWLKVLGGAGVIRAGSFQQISVLADTSSLKVGDYSATLTLHSTGGDKAVGIQLSAVHTQQKQAKLDVNPGTLDFGQVPQGQQETLSLTVANSGTAELDWKANPGGASWLSLDSQAGKIQSGGQPQTIQVTADTTSLGQGNHTARLSIPSNGGNTSVDITLTVTQPQIRVQPILVSSPTGFSAPGDPNCTYDSTQGWSCTVSLSSYKSAPGDLNWSASSSGVNGVLVNPSKGTLSPGGSTKVTIFVPNTVCPAQADITFSGGADPVDKLWTCAAGKWSLGSQSFNANTDCPYATNQGWVCTEILTEAQGSEGELSWSASGGLKGTTFSPSSGTLSPNQPVEVFIFIPSTQCPASASFTFSVPHSNPGLASWSCGLPTPTASPGSLNGNTDCSYAAGQGWTCTVNLSLGSKNQGDPSLNWSATGSGINGIKFSPANGTLSVANPTATITITVPSVSCPKNASFIFSSGGQSATVSWNCSPVSLVVSKSNLQGTDCTYTSGSGWSCTETLSLSSNNRGDPSLNWSAAGSGINGISFSPANGTVSSGNSTTVTINIPDISCPAGASFVFSPQGAKPVTVSWSCTAPQLSVDRGSINANSDCTWDTETVSWSCTVTLSNKDSQQNLKWSPSSSGLTDQAFYVSFNPANGILTPGQSVQVTINLAKSSHASCPSTNFTGTLIFTGPGNTADVTWGCSPPTLVVNPTSLNGNTDCSYTAGSGWTCSVTVSQQSQGEMSWSADSNGISGITFNPDNGRLVTSGMPDQVTVTIPDTTCPASANLIFSGQANTVTVPWSCSPPPTLTVNPTSLADVGSNACPYDSSSNTYTCTVTLSENSDAQSNLNWSASSDISGVVFSQSSGTLSPGQSVSVTISNIACQDGTFTFSGGQNPASATWRCGSLAMSYKLSFANYSAHIEGDWVRPVHPKPQR